jgi:hypothetical protein
MSMGKLILTSILQNSQEFRTTDEHTVSRVYFDLDTGDAVLPGLYADVKQTVGSDYERDPLEVSLPESLAGRLGYLEFRGHIEQYYRESFGPAGSAINFGPNARIIMTDNLVQRRKGVDVKLLDQGEVSGW